MERSFRRDTIIFISLSVTGLIAIGTLGAVLLGRMPSVFLRDKFTDSVWLFTCVFLIALWVWMYPKLQRNHDRQTS